MQEFKREFEALIEGCSLREETVLAITAYMADRNSEEKLQELFLAMHQEWLSQGGQFALPWGLKFLKPSLYNPLKKIDSILREYEELEEEDDVDRSDDTLDQRQFPPAALGRRGRQEEELFFGEPGPGSEEDTEPE